MTSRLQSSWSYKDHTIRERLNHIATVRPLRPGEKYSLLIRRDNDGDEDGGGVDGDGSGGTSPLWQGAGTETSVPRILIRRWWRLRNYSWNISRPSRVFPNRRRNRRRGGVEDALVGPDATQAWPRVWPRLGGVWPPSSPPPLRSPSGSQSLLVY